MIFLYLVLSLDKTIGGINSILPIVSYRNRLYILTAIKCMEFKSTLSCFTIGYVPYTKIIVRNLATLLREYPNQMIKNKLLQGFLLALTSGAKGNQTQGQPQRTIRPYLSTLISPAKWCRRRSN